MLTRRRAAQALRARHAGAENAAPATNGAGGADASPAVLFLRKELIRTRVQADAKARAAPPAARPKWLDREEGEGRVESTRTCI